MAADADVRHISPERPEPDQWAIQPDNKAGATGTRALRYRACQLAGERIQSRDRAPSFDPSASDWISGRIGDRLYVIDHVGRPTVEAAAAKRFWVYRQLSVMLARSLAITGDTSIWSGHVDAFDSYFNSDISFEELVYAVGGVMFGHEDYVNPYDPLPTPA